MKKSVLLLVLVIFSSLAYLHAQPSISTSLCGTPLQANDCADAPNPSICELDGFTGNTSGFGSGPADPFLNGFCGPGTGTQNSMWIGFTAATPQINIFFDVSNCVAGTGIQAAIIETDCTSFANSLGCIGAVPFGATGPFTLAASGLTVGDPYYIVIDGYAGDACDFGLTVLEGLPDVSFSATIFDPPPICEPGDETTLTASPSGSGYIYEWFGPGGNLIPGENSSTLTVDQIGDYSVQVHETTNCCFAESTASVTITTDAPEAMSLVGTTVQLDCTNSTATLEADFSPEVSGHTYQLNWNAPNGTTLNQDSYTLEVDQMMDEGEYTFQVWDQTTNCIDNIVIDLVINNETPIVDAGGNGMIECSSDFILDGSGTTGMGNLEYVWTYGTNQTVVNTDFTDPMHTTSIPGTYTLTVTNLDSGCSDTDMAEVELNNTFPSVNLGDDVSLSCGSGTGDITLSATVTNVALTDMLQYSWRDDSNTEVSMAETFTTDMPGEYTLVVTNLTNNCLGQDNVVIADETEEPTAMAGGDVALDCEQNTATITGMGAAPSGETVSYEWFNSANESVATGANLTVTTDDADTYTLVVTNTATNCSNSDDVVVTSDGELPTIEPVDAMMLNCDLAPVTLTANASNGTNLNYEWFNSTMVSQGTGNTLTTSVADTYTVVVSNGDNGCSSSAMAMVTLTTNATTASAGNNTSLTCDNGLTAMLMGSGTGTGTLSYEWFNSADVSQGTGANLSVTTADTYTLVVTDDANNCTSTSDVTVTLNDSAPTPDMGTDALLNCLNNQEVMLTGSATGVTNIGYQWQDPMGNSLGTNATQMVTTPGLYTLVFENTDNGCTSSTTFNVTLDDTTPENVTADDGMITCNQDNFQLTGSTTSSNVSIMWSGPGGYTSTEASPTITAPGDYTFEVTDMTSGCSATAVSVISSDDDTPNGPTFMTDADFSILTCATTSFNLMGLHDDINNVTLSWVLPNGDTIPNADIVVTEPGNYIIFATSLSGCESSPSNIIVNQDNEDPVIETIIGGTINCEDETIELSLTTMDNVNVDYNWDGPGLADFPSSPTPNVDAGGMYNVTVTDTQNGCTATSSVEVMADTLAPTVTVASPNTEITCNNPMLSLNADTPDSGLNYSWSTGETSSSIMVADDGVYTVTVTNPNNQCTDTSDLLIMENNTDPDAVADGTTISCQNTETELTATTDIDIMNANFEWSGPNGFTSMEQNPTSPEPGVYTLTVINTENGCSNQATYEAMPDTISPDASISNTTEMLELNCDNNTIVLNGSSTTSNVDFLWTGQGITTTNETEETPTVSESGDYTLLVTNVNNGCSTSQTVTVTQDENIPSADAMGEAITCFNQDDGIQLQGSASVMDATYLWTGPGISTTNEAEQNPTVTTPGDYTLVITDPANGCEAEASFTVDDETMPPANAAATGDTLLCTEPTVELMASSDDMDVTYLWSGGSIDMTNETMQNPMVSQAGTYTVLITSNVNGCSTTTTAEVINDVNAPDATSGATGLGVLACNILETEINGSSTTPNTSLEWIFPDGTTSTDATTMVSDTGNYTLIVTDDLNGCTSESFVYIFGDYDEPGASAMGGEITCQETSFMIEGSTDVAGSMFEWTGPGIDMNNMNSSSPSVSANGTYNLTVTGPNGCTSTAMTEVTLDEATPTVDATGVPITCFNQDDGIQLEGTASIMNAEFLWTGPGIDNSNEAEQNPTVTMPGDYTLLITDPSNGCQVDTTITVDDNTMPPANASATGDTIFCTAPTVELNALSDDMDVTYLWSGGSIDMTNESMQNPMVTVAGTYSVTITSNANGCTATTTAEVINGVNEPDATAGATGVGVLSCDILEVEINGASTTPNTSLEWTYPDGTTNMEAMPMVSDTGNYTLIVTDNTNGCTSEAFVTIFGDYDEPGASAVGGEITCQETSISIEGATDVAGSMFEWSGPGIDMNNMSSTSPNVDVDGAYNLVVTGPNGCTSTAMTEVTLDAGYPTAQVVMEELTLTCSTEMVTLDGSNSDANMTYEWTSAAGTTLSNEITTDVSDAGTYILYVTDDTNGCESTDTINVLQNIDLPTAEAGETQTFTCQDTELTLNGGASTDATGGTDLSYNWDGITNTETATILGPGTYTLIVTDNTNGCTDSDMVEIAPDVNAPTALVSSSNTLTCSDTETTLDGSSSMSMSGSDLTFDWSLNGNSVGTDATATVSSPGVYTLLITDMSNGCVDTEQFEVTQDIDPPAVNIADPNDLTCTSPTIALDGAGSETNGATYLWTASNGGMIESGETTLNPVVNNAGTYTLEVTSMNNGCTNTASVQVMQDADFPNAIINIEDEFTCSSNEVNLNANGSSSITTHTYAWSGPNVISGADANNVVIGQAGTYELLVTNTTTGCVQTTSVDIPANTDEVTDAAINILNESCTGSEDGLVSIEGVTGGTGPYMYALDDGFLGQTPAFSGLAPGTYNLLVQDAEGCEYPTTVTVEPGIDFVLELGQDITINIGDSVVISPQVNGVLDTLTWSNPNLTGNNPSFSPVNTLNYQATAIDENGCTDTDNITIFVERIRNVYIPNAFSPGDDGGINDIFYIHADNSVARIVNFRVFDRWGEVMYEAADFQPNDATYGWNGFHRDRLMRPAVFVYIAEIEFKDGLVEFFKGDVTLMR